MSYLVNNCGGSKLAIGISGGSPAIGDVVLLTFEGYYPPYGCYLILDDSSSETSAGTGTIVDTFSSCAECGGTYTGVTVDVAYTYPNYCCDATSGITGTGDAYPKPIYATDGGVRLQSMSVRIGGFDGLNN